MMSQLFEAWNLGPISLRNRVIKSATNEGMAKGGVPSKMLVEYHRRVAAGGAALSTVAYCAVEPDGMTFPDQVCMTPNYLPHLRALTDAVHQHDGAACAQITHGGAFNFLPELSEKRPGSASGGFNPVGLMVGRPFKRAMDKKDRAHVTSAFVSAAKLAREAGFDAVEIHMGHGYLLSQFISPLYNQRKDEYGGNAGNRARYPAEILDAVLNAVGKDIAVITKMSVIEGHSNGASLIDSVQVAKTLEAAGAHAIVLSAGMNVESPWQIFGSQLPAAVSDTVENPIMRIGARVARLREPKIEFQPLYLRDHSLEIRKVVKSPLIYLGGAKSLPDMQTVIDDGFEGVAVARALLHEPNLVNQYQNGLATESGCTSCNECVVSMYTEGGTACVLNPPNSVALNQQPAA